MKVENKRDEKDEEDACPRNSSVLFLYVCLCDHCRVRPCLRCSIAPLPSFRFSFFLHHNHGLPPLPWLQNSFCKSRHDPELTNILKFSSLLSELPKVLAFWCVLVCGCVWRRRCYLYRALLSLGAASLG